MRTFLFIFLAGYAVRCDDNYYVVRMPQEIQSKEFKVYWNVPTMQCKSKKIPFEDLYEEYGIIQNTDDTHRGDKISILYDPGNFPALIKNESTGEIKYRNGGVPQQGSLLDHIQIFKHELEQSIPDENFNGMGIIDFESWRPILRQNFGVLTPYKDVSFDIEKKRHWWWKKQWIQEEAKRRFEEAGRDFMQTTLALAKKLRPKALWGYYGYPQCFNRAVNNNPEKCSEEMPKENNEIEWLWSESTALFPSVYSTQDMSTSQLAAFIRGRLKESDRVRVKGTPILPYWWYRYRDGGYFTQKDLDVAFSTFYKSSATGFIIWGSSKDVNTKEKCLKLREYVTNTLGPTVAKYAKPDNKIDVVFDEITSTTLEPEHIIDLDPEYNWVPPENYTQNIEHIVDEELKKENETKFEINEKINESALITIILHKIANYCSENCHDKYKTHIVVNTEASNVLTTKDPFKDTSVKFELLAPTTTEDDGFIYDYLETTTETLDKNVQNNYNTTSADIINLTIAKSDYNDNFNNNNIFTDIKIDKTILNTDKEVDNSVNDIFNYSEDYTTVSVNNIDNNKTYFSSTDANAIKYSTDDTRTYYNNSEPVQLYETSFSRYPYEYEISTTESSEKGTSTIIWSTFNSSMEDIVNTSAKMENTIRAVNTTTGPMVTEQVVVSVV